MVTHMTKQEYLSKQLVLPFFTPDLARDDSITHEFCSLSDLSHKFIMKNSHFFVLRDSAQRSLGVIENRRSHLRNIMKNRLVKQTNRLVEHTTNSFFSN